MKTPSRKAFTLIEMVGVVALLGILTAGAVVGLMQQRDNAKMNKVLQCLSAIDQAKQTWLAFSTTNLWPADEPSRWAAIRGYLNTTSTMVSPANNNSYNAFNGFLPDQKYQVWIQGVTQPCQAQQVVGGTITPITRSL
jgi:prepilin-type N-terminal cleavage/methylation domain-containing protein